MLQFTRIIQSLHGQQYNLYRRTPSDAIEMNRTELHRTKLTATDSHTSNDSSAMIMKYDNY